MKRLWILGRKPIARVRVSMREQFPIHAVMAPAINPAGEEAPVFADDRKVFHPAPCFT
jgi:hypothetical protein